MTTSIRMFFATTTLLASSIPLMAGGLYVVLGNPEANQQARLMGAVLTLKLAGCHEPEKAQVSAVAIGSVDGRRRSIHLELKRLSEPGTYALMPQWPENGRWVLRFVAKDGDRVSSTLVASGPHGVERNTAKMAMKIPADSDVEAMLATASKPDVARR